MRAAASIAIGLFALTMALPSPGLSRPPSSTKVPRRAGARPKAVTGGARARARSIRQFFNRWSKTRYQWGGTSKSGVDCSGYARQMYRDIWNVELPRTTRQQIKLGQDVAVRPGHLGDGFEPGDLFFYVDPAGIPNHVVIYMGNGQFTHSASGRGVVSEGFKALWGRRVVGRRVLVPSKGGAPGVFGPIPPAPEFVPVAVPCPPNIRARASEIRRFRVQALDIRGIKNLPEREICEWKALAKQLRRRGGRNGAPSAAVVDEHVRWLESIDSFKDEAF